MRRRSAGQALPLVLVVLLAAGLAMVVVTTALGAVAGVARARTAADAAALAGARGGRPAAERVASANGARLERWTVLPDGTVEARVAVAVLGRQARATARARVVLTGPGA